MNGRARRSPVQAAVLAVLGFYQRAVSPALPPRCRFVPSCSAYAVEAVERHGATRGSWLALCRVLKCAPWHPGGVDLVPEPRHSRRSGTQAAAHSSNTAAPTPVAAFPGEPADAPRRPGSSHTAGLGPGPAAGGLR